MDDNEVKTIPWIAHEAEMTRMERANRRLFVLCIIIFVAMVVTNGGWIYYESQFEDDVITQEISQDSGEGGNNSYNGKIVGGDYYGEADDQDNGTEEKQENGR